jgi:phage repressor protein C with HTH and peptisase S24 domain
MYALTHSSGMSTSPTLVAKNLEWLMADRKTNPYDLQRATGVPQPTIHRILTGESSDPRTKTLEPLADYFGVTVAELRDRDLGSDAEPRMESNATFANAEAAGGEDPRMVYVPKIPLRLSAGVSGYSIEPEPFDGSTMLVSREWCDRRGLDPKLLLWVQVGGRSMEKTLYDKDWVLTYRGWTEPKNDTIFAINYDGEPVIKRLTRDAGQWWLTSDNPDPQYYRRLCSEGECQIVGQALLKHSEAL